jgi:hypothetical protein
MAFDGNGQPVFGRLNTDRPHQLKLYGNYEFKFGLGIGAFFRAASGIPISRQTNIETSTPVFYEGRLTDGRTPIFTQTDLQLTQDIRVPGTGNRKFQVLVNIQNLFEQSGTLDVFRNTLRDVVPLSSAQFLTQGFDFETFLSTHPTLRRDPRFLQPNTWQYPRASRIGAKFTF